MTPPCCGVSYTPSLHLSSLTCVVLLGLRALADLMWSDPEDIETWAVSSRGAGWLFGCKVTQQFNQVNGLELICRAHQLVQEVGSICPRSDPD